MATIEMQCPGCQDTLELDAGFAGGVCRCSNCGTLMTVPRDSGSTAERLERPAAPGQRPETPDQRRESPDAAAADKAQSANDADTATDTQAPDDSTSEQVSTETLTTESGRTVRIERDAVIPTAQRKTRPLVRAVTAALILLAFAGIVAITVFALMTATGDGPATTTQNDSPYQQEFGFDPDANVYTLEHANVLGLPIEERCAVIVDASGNTAGWLWLVNEAVNAGLTKDGDAAEVGLIYATEIDGPQTFPQAPQPMSELSEAQLAQFQESITPRGVAPLRSAVEQALAWEAERIILITGKRLDASEVAPIDQAMADAPDVTLDVVIIDAEQAQAKALADRHGGQRVRISPSRLRQWHRAAEAQSSSQQ